MQEKLARRGGNVLWAYYALTFVLGCSIWLYFNADASFRDGWVCGSGWLGVVAYLIIVLAARAIVPAYNWFGVHHLFLVSYVLVHFQFALLLPVAQEFRGDELVWFAPYVAEKALAVSVSGICAFGLGSLIALRSPISGRATVRVIPRERIGALVGTFFGLSLIAYVVFLGLVGPSYISGAYQGTLNWGAGATYSNVVLMVGLIGGVAADMARLRLGYGKVGIVRFLFLLNRPLAVLALICVTVSMYVGDRGPAIQILVAYSGGYFAFFGRSRFWHFLVVAAIGMFTVGFVGLARTTASGVNLSTRVEEGLAKTSSIRWYHVSGEMGGSVRCLTAAVALGESGNYYRGLFFLGNFASAVPFASKALIPVVGVSGSGITSSDLLAVVILGPNSDVGTGTTVVADVYLDFGWVGVILVVGLLGWVIGSVERWALVVGGVYWVTWYIVMASFAVYWGRATLVPNAKVFFWTVLVVFVFDRFLVSGKRVRAIAV